MQLIQQHKSIEKVLEHLDKDKYKVPEDWPYQEARRLFKEPDVQAGEGLDVCVIRMVRACSLDALYICIRQFKWTDPDEDALVQFMVREKGFSEERIRGGVKRLMKQRGTSAQGRLDSFFKPVPKSDADKAKLVAKRKVCSFNLFFSCGVLIAHYQSR